MKFLLFVSLVWFGLGLYEYSGIWSTGLGYRVISRVGVFLLISDLGIVSDTPDISDISSAIFWLDKFL